tara:strand:+ start:104 stop:703 length:600 start_codon:yes stop_codon:yes gene_type:complete
MSQLKLTADGGGGTVAIKGPASTTGNNAFELTVPGTASGTILTSNSSVGKILQVVQTTKTDTQSIQSQTFTDISGMSVTITPTSASSKILVMFSISVATSSYGMVNLVRGSTDIFKGNSTGSRVNCTVAAITQNSYECETYSHTFLDSPNTTSATTYKLQACTPHNASYTVMVNRATTDTDYNYVPRPVSSITVMEVAA